MSIVITYGPDGYQPDREDKGIVSVVEVDTETRP